MIEPARAGYGRLNIAALVEGTLAGTGIVRAGGVPQALQGGKHVGGEFGQIVDIHVLQPAVKIGVDIIIRYAGVDVDEVENKPSGQAQGGL